MNVYVETNFVLELVFEQEEVAACNDIVQLAENGKIILLAPAYSFVEPNEKMVRQANNRRELQTALNKEVSQLRRTASYTTHINSIDSITTFLLQSSQEERSRFIRWRDKLLRHTRIIPLTHELLTKACTFEGKYALNPQDAIVFASVKAHLEEHKPTHSCFLNRNTKDFDTPDIVAELKNSNCKIIPRFDHGLQHIHARLSTGPKS